MGNVEEPGFFKILFMEKKENSRRKFLAFGATAGAFALVAKFGKVGNLFRSREAKTETVKMLTQDGTLVEVNINRVKACNKKATKQDLQGWIKR